MGWNAYYGPKGLDMPIMESQQEKFIYNVMDGKKWSVSDMGVAERNAAFYASQGKVCTIETEIKTVGYERVWHGPSGAEYNGR